jgi:hypothetical protein
MFFCLPFFLLQSSGIKVLEADMLDLPFSNGVFDVIIEKGTMVNVQFVMFSLSILSEFLYVILGTLIIMIPPLLCL